MWVSESYETLHDNCKGCWLSLGSSEWTSNSILRPASACGSLTHVLPPTNLTGGRLSTTPAGFDAATTRAGTGLCSAMFGNRGATTVCLLGGGSLVKRALCCTGGRIGTWGLGTITCLCGTNVRACGALVLLWFTIWPWRFWNRVPRCCGKFLGGIAGPKWRGSWFDLRNLCGTWRFGPARGSNRLWSAWGCTRWPCGLWPRRHVTTGPASDNRGTFSSNGLPNGFHTGSGGKVAWRRRCITSGTVC